MTVETGVDLSDAGGIWSQTTGATVLKITSPGLDEGLEVIVGGSNKTDTIYLLSDTAGQGSGRISVFYVDSNNDVKFAGNISMTNVPHSLAYINYQDTKSGDLFFTVYNTTAAFQYIDIYLNSTVSSDNLKTHWGTSSGTFDHLGDTADDSDGTELVWHTTNIGTRQYDQRTKYGVVVKNPDSNGASDKVVLSVPADQVKAKVVVYGPGGTSSTTEGGKIKKVVPVTTTVAKLDTEVDPTTVGKHLVLVGGPAVNRLTAQAMGLEYPTYGSSGLLPFGEGEGYIRVYDSIFTPGQVVVVVAGWEAENTRMATSLLQQYDTFAEQLGSNTAVKVTSLSASGITPA